MDITHSSYNILTNNIIEKYGGKPIANLTVSERQIATEKSIEELITRVKNGEIWFPFQKYFRGEPSALFANLRNINLPVLNNFYRLYSYYPIYKSYLPPKFRGSPIHIAGDRSTYDNADVLSDHFIEDIRLRARRSEQIRSVLDCWVTESCLKVFLEEAMKKDRITPQTLRDAIYQKTAETKIFNPTWARALLKLVMGPNLIGKKWLDISAGWGDRLLAAMSLDMEYTGYDPNMELQPGHTAMIEKFGDPKIHRIIYEPFEKAKITGGPYDVVLSSPPYYTVEIYNENQEGQSIVSYPEFNQWMVWFLFASLNNAWDNLKEGGYLILHLGDSKDKDGIKGVHSAEPTNIYIENYLPGASWEGVIGIQGEAGFSRPVWVWKKVSSTVKPIVWEPNHNTTGALNFINRTLYNTYPDIQTELSNFYGSKYTPNYLLRKNNAIAIRDHVAVTLPSIPRNAIDKILHDDLMISSLLESIGIDKTIVWGTAMVKLAFPR